MTVVKFPAEAMKGIFLFATQSRPTMGPIELPSQSVSGAFPLGKVDGA